MRDENNFIFSEKLLRHYVENLRLLRALVVKYTRSYSICGKISYHRFLVVIFGHFSRPENFRKIARTFICGTRQISCFQKKFSLTMRTI